MMEEIDFLDQDLPNPFDEKPKKAPHNNTSEPIRLPRTSGPSRGTFLRDTLQSQIPTTEQLQNTKKQAGKLLKGFGNQLSKLNVGKLIDKMEQDQGLADSLEQLNMRMKEEVERQEVRREAEELTIKVITDHLSEFLTSSPAGTYEEWIQDLHPENANQGQLLSDIQQIDERFYVLESDHRKLWNEAIETHGKQRGDDPSSYEHRIVKARAQIWGKAPNAVSAASPKNGYSDVPDEGNAATIDFLSASNEQSAPVNNGIEEIDFFAPVANPTTTTTTKSDDPFGDLLQF